MLPLRLIQCKRWVNSIRITGFYLLTLLVVVALNQRVSSLLKRLIRLSLRCHKSPT